ncbi:MAG: PIN domain-containing protein [Ignavibacteria bacterium]|nr:PIN domain-containing protein [Ignavibacteria bacterium]
MNPIDMQSVVQNIKSYNLDFDDAYQLSCTRKYNFKLVSFDKDFDRTPTKRLEPKDLLG